MEFRYKECTVFWHVTLYRWVSCFGRFEQPYCPHLTHSEKGYSFSLENWMFRNAAVRLEERWRFWRFHSSGSTALCQWVKSVKKRTQRLYWESNPNLPWVAQWNIKTKILLQQGKIFKYDCFWMKKVWPILFQFCALKVHQPARALVPEIMKVIRRCKYFIPSQGDCWLLEAVGEIRCFDARCYTVCELRNDVVKENDFWPDVLRYWRRTHSCTL